MFKIAILVIPLMNPAEFITGSIGDKFKDLQSCDNARLQLEKKIKLDFSAVPGGVSVKTQCFEEDVDA
jgi:hypothetical protein